MSQKTPNTGTSLKINTTFSTSASEKFDANPDTNMLTSQKVGSNLNTFTDTTTASSFSQFLNEKSTDTATSDLDLGSYMSTAQDSNTKVHTEDGAGLDNFADMFGQPTPISLRERIERGYLRKHSNAKAKSGKMKKVINQFVSNLFIYMCFPCYTKINVIFRVCRCGEMQTREHTITPRHWLAHLRILHC